MSNLTVPVALRGPGLASPRRAVPRRAAGGPTLARRGGLRLTRRGRAVVLLAALVVALTLGVFVGADSVATRDPGAQVRTQVVVVGDGETLWGIASEIASEDPTGDVRSVMHEIQRLNALETGMLYAGQRLRVPRPD